MKAVATVLCLALSALPLAACSGQQANEDTSAPSEQAAALDTSSWKTLGDALATQTDSMSSGWDDNYYVAVFHAGDSVVRVVAKMTSEASDKLDAVDWLAEDVDEQVAAAVGSLELVSAEDLTPEIVSQDELDSLKGKTGQDLVDAGWTYSEYFMYGGDQTGAIFERGLLTYSFTFDVTTPEEATDDGGASIMDATITEAEFQGAANSATDPTIID